MKKCEKCGTELKNAPKFCPHCGTPVKADEINNASAAEKAGITGMFKQNPKMLAAAAAAVILVIVLLILLLSPKNMKITPEEYITISSIGLNGEGRAALSFDEQSFIAAIKEEKKLKPAQESELAGILAAAEEYFVLSKSSELFNDEEITISSSMPEDYLDAYGVSIENKAAAYKIAGLIERQVVNVSDYAVIETSGFDGYGYLHCGMDYDRMYQDVAQMIRGVEDSPESSIYIDNNLYSTIVYMIDDVYAEQNENLSNGNNITISCQLREEQPRIERYGIIFESEELIWEVSGLEAVETVALGEYLKTEFTGYQGAGELVVSVDTEKLNEAMSSLIPENRNGYTAEEAADYIRNRAYNWFNIGADVTDMLSNGDEVRVYAEAFAEDTYIDEIGIVLEAAEKTVTAEGLEEPEEMDLMDLLTVTFTGICPEIRIETEIDGDHPLYHYLVWNSVNEIPYRIYGKNGDVLEITLEADEQWALKNGYKIVNTTQSYEVTGLDTYDILLDSVETEGVAEIAESGRVQMYHRLLENESRLLETFNGGKGTILWPSVKSAATKAVKIYAERAYYDVNTIVFVYEYLLPIKDQDETTAWHSAYAVSVYKNVTQAADGTYTFPREAWNDYYTSAESLEEKLTQIANNVSREKDSECLVTEAVNASAADMLSVSEMPPEPSVEEVIAVPPEKPEIPEANVQNPAAVIEYDGRRYYRFDDPISWEEAKLLCSEAGGNLASVTSWTEQSVIQYLIEDAPLDKYWLGASDEENEGVWKWIDGEPFVYTNWDGSQPDNNKGTEHYLEAYKHYDGRWNDSPGEAGKNGYILEVSVNNGNATEYLAETKALSAQNDVKYYAWNTDTYGNIYYGVIGYDASNNAWSTYELDGKYTRLSGCISTYEEAATGVSFDFAVFGDGKLLYKKRAVTRQTAPVWIDLDVSGVEKLTIAASNMGEYRNGYLLFGDAKLYKAEQAEMLETTTDRLAALTLIESNAYEADPALWEDSLGDIHEGYVRFDASSDSFALWNLDKAYTAFNAVIATGRKTGSGVSLMVQVYGDDELLYEYEGFDRTQEFLEISVDVTGCQTLKIVAVDQNNRYNGYLYICDDVLLKEAKWTPAEEIVQADVEIDEKLAKKAIAVREYQDKVLYLMEDAMTWEDAAAYCKKAGGRLMSVNSKLEQTQLYLILNDMPGDSYWIGAADADEEGEWIWSDGSLMEWTNWDWSQPDNYRESEHYLEADTNDCVWNDEMPDKEQGFVLEIPLEGTVQENKTAIADMEDRIITQEDFKYYHWVKNGWEQINEAAYTLDASRNAWVSYDLNGEYSEISGLLSVYRDAGEGAKINIGFFGDGKPLYTRSNLGKLMKPEEFSIDLTGVKTLTIRTDNNGDYGYGMIILGDTVFTKADEAAETVEIAQLNTMQQIDSSSMEYSAALMRDTYGALHDGRLRFDACRDGYVVYLLDGAYTEFSGVICAGAQTKSGNVMNLAVYADDKLVYELNGMSRSSMPETFAIDVTDVKNLKIQTTTTEESYDGYLFIVDHQLK